MRIYTVYCCSDLVGFNADWKWDYLASSEEEAKQTALDSHELPEDAYNLEAYAHDDCVWGL